MRSGPAFSTELRWAWRGVRARRFSGLVHAALVALAAGASGIVFAAADAFVFRPAPYPNADRLVVFQRTSPVGVIDMLTEAEYRAVSARSDLFSGMYGYALGPSLLIRRANTIEPVRVYDVEPGFFEALGVRPRWGRSFLPGDELPGREPIVVLREDVARGMFGDPAKAIDQTIDAGSARLRVVGVMPPRFRFPTALDKAWRPLAAGPVGETRSGQMVAVLAPNVRLETVSPIVEALAPADRSIGAARAALLRTAQKDPRAYTNSGAFTSFDAPRLFAMLLGAVVCLAAIIWLNVTGLALATALERTRARALQAVLGASRATLIRTSILETLIPTAAGAAAGLGIATWGTAALSASIPAALDTMLTNPIDLDLRAFAFLAAVAGAGAIVTSLPAVWWASRAALADRLRHTSATATMSRRQLAVRHGLMTGQVALSVLLLVLGVLLVRSYFSRLGEDRGFDSRGLATIEVRQPRGASRTAAELERDIVARLEAAPAVSSVARTNRLPPGLRGGTASHLWIQGQPSAVGQVANTHFDVDPGYFETMGIRLLAGRFTADGDSPDQVVVDAEFARRFWPAGNAVGGRFSTGRADSPGSRFSEIVGVASRVRLDTAQVPQGGDVYVVHHTLARTAAPLTFVVRLTAPDRLRDVTAIVRSADPDSLVRTELMDHRYAEIYGDTRIAAGLGGSFAVMAFLVAMVGLYGVTAVLATTRTREMGIRIALGASRTQIRRLILLPAIRLLGVGILCGAAGALLTSRWIASQLYGVQSSDPATYLGVATIVAIAALAAMWRPARRAANVDPIVTLRAE
jgi:predicted permease